MIIIEIYIKPVPAERQIGTDIFIEGLLPFQIRITEGIDQYTGSENIGNPVIKGISGIRLVRIEILISRITDRSSYF